MATVRSPISGDRAVLHSIAQVLSEHIHEVNNKLGSILLNAEMLAAKSPDKEGPAKDIVQSAVALLEMSRDLEASLPRRLEADTPLQSLLELASRLVKGILRKRKIELVLPELGDEPRATKDHLAAFATMLLVPLAFPLSPSGHRAMLQVQLEDGSSLRRWNIELSPPCELDENVVDVLRRLCSCHAWTLESGTGKLVLLVPRN